MAKSIDELTRLINDEGWIVCHMGQTTGLEWVANAQQLTPHDKATGKMPPVPSRDPKEKGPAPSWGTTTRFVEFASGATPLDAVTELYSLVKQTRNKLSPARRLAQEIEADDLPKGTREAQDALLQALLTNLETRDPAALAREIEANEIPF